MPVVKNKLEIDLRHAGKLRKYLNARADGVPRNEAARQAGLQKQYASLLGIDRNALTYAGFVVWNMRKRHHPTREDDRRTMLWRPRSEWVISDEPKHPALITKEQAERILAAVEKQNPKPAQWHRKPEQFLLTGLLVGPDGTPWQGDGKFYRLGRKGKRLLRDVVDMEVLQAIAKDVKDKEFVGKVVQQAHDMADHIDTSPDTYVKAIRSLEQKLAKLVDLAGETGNRSIVAKIEAVEAEIDQLQRERQQAAEREGLKKGLRALTTKQVEAMLEFAPTTPQMDVPYMRRTLATLVERVELDPATRAFAVHYRIPLLKGKPGSKGGGGAGRGTVGQRWRPHGDSYSFDSSLRRYLGSIRVPLPDLLLGA